MRHRIEILRDEAFVFRLAEGYTLRRFPNGAFTPAEAIAVENDVMNLEWMCRQFLPRHKKSPSMHKA
ncbi:hypothetical protein [Pontibacter sp. G13]|uniref:hypothetical protein n=1 Tax=Pontibacter sp. G13 TaxID=3074898 RepID=UPI00288ABF35|nr:hypothetical protein [Pontibacter sp. G13]WNJ20583.1 hypothetical protein RJD25_08875 [Pontibacter sp. G13]